MPGDGPVVLDRDRHAGERPRVAGTDLRGGSERLLVGHVREGVDPRFELVDPLERGGDELGSAKLAGTHQLGQFQRGTPQQL